MSEQTEQRVSKLEQDLDALETKVTAIKENVDRGLGIVIGVLAVIGLFSGEIVNWVKHLFRLP